MPLPGVAIWTSPILGSSLCGLSNASGISLNHLHQEEDSAGRICECFTMLFHELEKKDKEDLEEWDKEMLKGEGRNMIVLTGR